MYTSSRASSCSSRMGSRCFSGRGIAQGGRPACATGIISLTGARAKPRFWSLARAMTQTGVSIRTVNAVQSGALRPHCGGARRLLTQGWHALLGSPPGHRAKSMSSMDACTDPRQSFDWRGRHPHARRQLLPGGALCSFSITFSRLKLPTFWLGGNSLNDARKAPTCSCAGTSRKVRSMRQCG